MAYDAFEQRLLTLYQLNSPWEQPVIDVADTMNTCVKWFRSYDIEPTAADLLEMAKMIINEKHLQDDA